jgi:hypothetical protein
VGKGCLKVVRLGLFLCPEETRNFTAQLGENFVAVMDDLYKIGKFLSNNHFESLKM